MKNKDLRVPENFEEYYEEDIMSNLDKEIIQETVEAIKGKALFSPYPGRDFWGKVWWQNDLWHCEVWVYRVFQETFSAETLEEIMKSVCSEYGDD